MIIRAKTKYLFDYEYLGEEQRLNTQMNISELENKETTLKSYPRRLVFELTNNCNLNCVMCGRNSAKFSATRFDMDWLPKFSDALSHVEEVTLMGWGEPTVHPQFADILKYLNNYPVKKYFCTNGMRLDALHNAIFDYKADIIAVSVDGATPQTNDRIRRGSSLKKITDAIKAIEKEKGERGLSYPYINFVFCAMKSNLHELPGVVRLAHEIGIEEVKVVYLTVFDDRMMDESLWGCEAQVAQVFDEAAKLGEQLNIKMKLPYVSGYDEAGEKPHRDCFVAWRDFFLGSDGFIRPCMSTPVKLFSINDYNNFFDMWNSKEFVAFRKTVNDPENMSIPCRLCYQSSHCNWNKQHSFIQVGNTFSPDWSK